MASMTSYLQKKLLDDLLGIAPYTPPATLYLSLHTASPGESGSHANEISTIGTAYARIPITPFMGATDPSSGVSLNTTLLIAGPATLDWGTVTYIGIEDALTAGNMLLWGAPTTAKTVTVGEGFQLVPAQLQIQFD